MTITAKLQNILKSTLLPGLLLGLAVSLLYGGFLWNPIVFDDVNFFDGHTAQAYGHSVFHFDLRWFAYASLGWTENLFGQNLIGFRLGNLALHAATVITLFLFLRCVFDAALPRENVAKTIPRDGLSHTWLAFFGALLFAVHPVSVYAAGYLIERSIVMATLFGLLTLYAYLQGLLSNKKGWFVASAFFYFIAVFSKEHAVMAPAVALALTFLLYPPSRALFKKIALPFALFALIGALVILKSKGVLGSPYEPFALDMLKNLSDSAEKINVAHAYPLSIETQSFLFFKYLGLWLLPNPAWMSVDMREPFATSMLAWPNVLGVPCFVLYGAASLWLLLQRGRRGLLGFALLFPWLQFATEMSTVRIQEPFVLYRSYLWMGGLFAALPLLLGDVPARRAVVYLLGASLLIAPLAWNRLTTFSHPLLLWDDAASLIQDRPYSPGFERIYFNRGHAFYQVNLKQKALEDYNRVIAYKPDYSYVYSDRGAVYFDWGQYQEALRDFNKSIELKPDYANPYLGRGMVFEALHDIPAARADFQKNCELGMQAGCDRLRKMGGG